MIRTVEGAVERQATRSRLEHAAHQATQSPGSSCCGAPVQGTSAVRWCGDCGHTIRAADIDHEYKPRTGVTR